MLESWVVITVAAAFFQNLRSVLQKQLKERLSTTGAAYSRFIYALPVAAIYLWLLLKTGTHALPESNPRFLMFCLLGGVCQMLFTVCLLWMFSFQSFAVGTTFSKLEVIMVAVLGTILLGDSLSFLAMLAIVVSSLGVMALSLGEKAVAPRSVLVGLFHRSTVVGLICAGWLGSSVVFYRGASLALAGDNYVIRAAWTLFVSLVVQTLLMGGYLIVREPGEIARVIREWRWAGAAGLAGAFASIGWFTAFTIQNASYVRAVGQVELLFTVLATTLYFREKVTYTETVGMIMISGGILILLIYG